MTKFPQIHNSYRKLRSRYLYEDDEYLIRPARSAAEIVEEGRTLHHCVEASRQTAIYISATVHPITGPDKKEEGPK